VKVNPRGTSQICSGCGCQVKKTLSMRIHYCSECFNILDCIESCEHDFIPILFIVEGGSERVYNVCKKCYKKSSNSIKKSEVDINKIAKKTLESYHKYYDDILTKEN
jgi:hypothetical protein